MPFDEDGDLVVKDLEHAQLILEFAREWASFPKPEYAVVQIRQARAALARAERRLTPYATSSTASDQACEGTESIGEEVSDGAGGDAPEPGAGDATGSLGERFASVLGEVLGDLDGDTRRLEGEMAKRDHVYVLAFQEVQAAMKQVAEVVRPLFDLRGVEVEDVQALLNGTAKGVYLSWAEDHPERRRLHEL